MGDNHSFLALDWVKGEIEETLKQARQALEAFVENPEDGTRMRFCLAYLHQVHGTLQMVEFYGAALLAEEMEKLCLALINNQVARVADGQEVLMRAILQLPPYLERVKASRRDLPVVLLPLLNDLRAVRGEPLMSETALFTPDLTAGERAPIQVSSAVIDPALVKKIRQMYQVALLGLIRNDNVSANLGYMAQVFSRLEKMAGAAPIRELWLVSNAVVEGLAEKTIDLGTSIKMLLGLVDRQLRLVGEDGTQRAPTELLKNLLYYVAKSPGSSTRLRAIKELYRLDEALPGDALVSEERARMSGPDREAMKSVVDALCEELARAKDALDLFVRSSERKLPELGALVPVLKQVADTVAVLGLGQPRRILQEQIERIDGITSAGLPPDDGSLLDIAGALLYVEATLMGMVAEKPMGQPAASAASEFSAQDQLSDAQTAVLRESRSALEKSKDAIIEYIASQWNPTHLESIPDLISTVRGGLAILGLHRPAFILGKACAYVSERLLEGQHRPDWQEMDTLADVITSVEYFLERVANDASGSESVLEIAERGLEKLGLTSADDGVAEEENEAIPESAESVDAGEWQAAEAAAFEMEMANAVTPAEPELPVETQEDEVLVAEGALPEAQQADASPDEVRTESQAVESADEWLAREVEGLGRPDQVILESVGVIEIPAEELDLSADLPIDEVLESAPDAALLTEDTLFADESASAFDMPIELDAAHEPEPEEVSAEAATLAEDATDTVVPNPEPTPVVEPPKKPVLPVLTAMPEDDHTFDEEIREIFVEEAEEVMELINEYFPKWAANFEDTASLLEFRRGFHTLKGSGRMVGAKVVGELAWAFETMLNKVRDKILAPDQVMVNLISECLSVIPALVEDFANRASPRINTGPLMAAAEAISRGEALSTLDVARAAEQAHAGPATEPDESAEAEAAFDALAASLAPAEQPLLEMVEPAEAVELPVDAVTDEHFIEMDAADTGMMPDDVLDDVLDVTGESIEAASTEAALPPFDDVFAEEAQAPLNQEMDVSIQAEPEIDLALLEIFTSEAETHLAELQAYLDGLDSSRSSALITDEVIRSLHTLKGSAAMAGIAMVTELAAPLEHLFKDLRNQGGSARQNHLQALRDGCHMITASIQHLNAGGSGEVAGADALIDHIRQLDHDRLAELERTQTEQLNDGAVNAVTAGKAGLVAGFMELGIDDVLDAPWELDGWLHGDMAAAKQQSLQNELHRLAVAASSANIEPLALLCERMSAVYAALSGGRLQLDNERMNDLAAAHDEIINIFDTLAASQTVHPNDAVLNSLLDLLETPSAAGLSSDEPVMAAFDGEDRSSLADRMTDAEVAAWEAPADIAPLESVDPELLEIFLEEADEVLEAAEAELEAWRHAPENLSPLAALQRHLHTLKGGARLAEIRALGDLSHELEFLYEGLVDGRYQAVPELTGLLQRCHDRLADMVSSLRSGGRCQSAMDLVNAINAFRRDPAAGIVEEVATPVFDEPVAPVSDEDAAAVFAEFFPDAVQDEPQAMPPAAAQGPEPTVSAPVTPAAGEATVFAPDEAVFDPELLEIFLEEAGEIVDDTSEQLAEWRKDTNNSLPVQQLQRGLHTLKGGARMAEISALGDLAHHMETLYEALCDGRMSATEPLFGLLNRCHDRLAVAVESLRDNGACPDTHDLVQQIERYSADPENFQEVPDTVSLTPVEPEPVPEPVPLGQLAPVTIEAAPVPENVDSDILEIFLEESNELAEGIESSLGEWLENRESVAPMEALLRHLHTLKGGARLAGLKELGNLAHDWETDLVAIQNGSKPADEAFFAELSARQAAVVASLQAVRAGIEAAAPPAVEAAPAPVVVAPATIAVPDITLSPVVPVAPVAAPVRSGERAQPPSMLGGFRKDAGARGPQEMIRVPSDLLEKLVNLAGETSITRSRVEMGVHGFAQTVEEMGATIQRLADQLRRMDSEMETQIVARHNEDTGGKYEEFDPLEMDQYSSLNQLSKALYESASDLLDLKSTLLDKARDTETLLLQQSRINTELQEGLMRSRMVPFSRLVPRLKRIVRQIGQEIGKPADLDVINPEGEMDRTLLERIVAPLEHMLRNAVDHGLEPPAGRAAAGKPAQGRVTLTLSREGGEVVLTLSDDGRGINIPAVRKKALERGLITEGQKCPIRKLSSSSSMPASPRQRR
jgi:chemosensory pili system protein ChpA (sensor histidine kinase/response regulator)